MNGLAATVAVFRAFMLNHVVIEACERVERSAADGAFNVRLVIVVVSAHGS